MDILRYVCCLLKLSVRNSENGFAFRTASLRGDNCCCSGCGFGKVEDGCCIFGSGGIAEDGSRLSSTEVGAVATPRRQAAVDIMHEVDVDRGTEGLDILAAAPLSCLRMSTDMMSML